MNRTINGYRRDLPHIQGVHETSPGHWEGRTVTGDTFFILGGSRAFGGRREWYTMAPAIFRSPAPVPVKSLAEGLKTVEESATPVPRMRASRRRTEAQATAH